ncbi:MAG: hypothetical protein Q9227_003460 [Pyrenula ochraceoflavens]
MFPGQEDGEWEPRRIRTKSAPTTNGTRGDIEMTDAPNGGQATNGNQTNGIKSLEVFEEDPDSTEGAVYPLQDGRIVNYTCFLALLSHIYNTLSPPFHTPVLIISQPVWSARDKEHITRFFFEVFNIPALAIMDAAVAACYAYSTPNALVIDIGQGKCDVTAVSDYLVNHWGRGTAVTTGGGEAMTLRLVESLAPRGLDRAACEQIKKSNICEILASSSDIPKPSPIETVNPAAVASTGALSSGPEAKEADGLAPGNAPRGPGEGTEVGEEGNAGEQDDEEGVLDVASIVARGNASEFLAKREKEKLDRLAAKKGTSLDTTRPLKLKNSEKEYVPFEVEEYVQMESNGATHSNLQKRKKTVEVGVERFMVAEPPLDSMDGVIDAIASTAHKVVQNVLDVPKRAELWDSIIILGNGSKVRGLVPGLLATLSSKYILSPSNSTIFTSELPSNLSTPLPTGGTNTPLGPPSHPMGHPAAHGVNPLLVAATHANQNPQSQSLQVPGADPSQGIQQQHSHRGHNQTPLSFKTVKAPEYLPEWKHPSVSGMEDAAFLGAQVAAKVVFVVDQGISKGFLTRSDYNELGPTAIHDYSLE